MKINKELFNITKRSVYLKIIILSFLIDIIIECLGYKSFIGGIKFVFQNPLGFVCNVLIILFTLSFSLLFRRRFFVITVISTIWVVLGAVNCFLLFNRVTPFTAMDFLNIDSGLAVMNKYFNVFTYALLYATVGAIITGLAFIFVKAPIIKNKIKYLRNIVIIVSITIITLIFLIIANLTGSLSLKFPELSSSYKKYGFVYCFSNSVFNSGVSKPNNYSKEEIDKLTEAEKNIIDKNNKKIETDKKNTIENAITPNIIIVQLESFFDITRINNMEFSKDPLPNWHNLKKHCASGLLSMPVVGAGTVNSEFEVLTGLNIDNFGPGEYPYKTVLKTNTCESICYNLKDLGYKSFAIHNNTAEFYGRNKVFSNLGFDVFMPIEYMNLNIETDYTKGGWAKDNILTKYINQALNSTKGYDYIYTISVQGHGSYNIPVDNNKKITIKAKPGYSIDNDMINSREYYISQINEMDKFVENLINSIKLRNEPSIVVFYGDHLPSLGFENEDFDKGDIYDTDYVIWDNLDDVVFDNEDMQAYEMESKILKKLNITNGVVNKYHQENKKSKDYLNGLQNLQYDIFNNKNIAYGGTNPFLPTNLKLGINDIKITSILKQTEENAPTIKENNKEPQITLKSDVDNIDSKDENLPDEEKNEDGYVLIRGENFTKYSKVYVNGEYFGDTEFINSNLLRIYYPKLQGLDTFVVSQTHSENGQLSSTLEMLYYGE